MRVIALVIAALLQLVPARAQDAGSPEALAAARELMSVMSRDMIAQLTQSMTSAVWPQIERQFGPRVDQATMSDLHAEFDRVLIDFVTESMKEFPVVYARYFTAQELRDIAGFYRTQAGAKALELMPKVMADAFGSLMPRMNSFQRETQERFEAILRQHGYQK